jgi:CubicO group peptidase (beta-lactamase class C family)
MKPRRRAALAASAAFAALPALVGLAWAPARAELSPAELEKAAADSDLHSLLVWQRGQMLLEHYRTSRDRPVGNWFEREVRFGPDVLHDLRSISKSVVGLLVGQAVGRGELDIHSPVLDHFPELADLRSGPQAGIQVAHLLHMSSGLAWNEGSTTYGTAANDETRLYWDRSPLRYILDRPMAAVPGAEWTYNGGSTLLLADLLQRRSGRKLLELARADLFEPMGIADWEWRAGQHGQPLAYAGLRITPRALLNLGRLMLDGGRWQGRSVVPPAWVDATLKPVITVGKGPLGYGHQWWSGPVESAGRTLTWTGGLGNGGQRLFCVPDLDLVVVMTAGQYNSGSVGGAEMRLFRRIVATL